MTKTLTRAALAGVFALGLVGAAQAQSIPTPANPTPRFPVATDGTPLPPYGNAYGDRVLTGRSAFAPVDGFVGTGLGIAGDAANVGIGTAGSVVDGTAGAIGVR